jgi:hypothetical protein
MVWVYLGGDLGADGVLLEEDGVVGHDDDVGLDVLGDALDRRGRQL